jgi:hypothetical protein
MDQVVEADKVIQSVEDAIAKLEAKEAASRAHSRHSIGGFSIWGLLTSLDEVDKRVSAVRFLCNLNPSLPSLSRCPPSLTFSSAGN